MQPATDDEVMALVARLDPTSGVTDDNAVHHVLEGGAAGEPVPPHPYREQWDLAVMLARVSSTCPFCRRDVEMDSEIAQWPMTHQWGHRQCVEDLAAAQPPTRERIRRRSRSPAR